MKMVSGIRFLPLALFRALLFGIVVNSAFADGDPVAQIQTFAYEDEDFGVTSTSVPKRSPYHAKTPLEIPNGKRVRTVDLKRMLDADPKPVVIDVLDSRARTTIPGAIWMKGAGAGDFYAAEKSRFATALEKLTGGDRSRPLVFLCFDRMCWLSYNASLYAIEAGYGNVFWFRGGTQAWEGASLKREKAEPLSW